MGTIDGENITLTCPSCGTTETCRILDKGNGYSGSHWQRPTFEKFEIAVTGTASTYYNVTGVCPSCQVAADVDARYSV